MTRIFLAQNTLDAARDRISRIYDEFEQVVVNTSGGKDSTVVFNLALEEAERRDRLPLDVMFIDQEAEWDSVIDYIKVQMYDPRVNPLWYQMHMQIANSSSGEDDWLQCWDPENEQDWIREKDPISIKENVFGTKTFGQIFPEFARVTYPGQRVAQLAGVRCEESPGRMQSLTSYATYKDITWGKRYDTPGQYAFYPLYDWSYVDVWKAIHDHGWDYCRIYDLYWQYGLNPLRMRVSNVHHETALHSLHHIQEFEPETWDRIVHRLQGVNSVNKAGETYRIPRELPFMFDSWEEYRDHLLVNLITDPKKQAIMRKQFAAMKRQFPESFMETVIRAQISAILVNDYHGTKLSTFSAAHANKRINAGKRRTQKGDQKRGRSD